MSDHGKWTTYCNDCRCEPCIAAMRSYRTSMRAQGLADGDARHGTTGGYTNWGCKCVACRAAQAKAQLAGNQRRAATLGPDDPRHGKVSTYTNYRCRCDACRAAQLEAGRAYRSRKKVRAA